MALYEEINQIKNNQKNYHKIRLLTSIVGHSYSIRKYMNIAYYLGYSLISSAMSTVWLTN